MRNISCGKLLMIMLLLLLCLAASPQQGHRKILMQNRAPAAGGACDVDYCQDFDATETPAGWANITGTVNFDNTSSPLDGAQDMLLDITEVVSYDPNYNATQYWWTFWLLWGATLEATETFFTVRNTGGTNLGTVGLRGSTSDWQCTATGGTSNNGGSATGYTTPPGVKLKVMLQKGTGTDAVITLWKWDGSGWGSSQCSSTNGTGTLNIDAVRFTNGADDAVNELLHIDQFKGHASDISTPEF